MTWYIKRFSAESGTGEVESDGSGVRGFDVNANVAGIRVFHEGEAVQVELDPSDPRHVASVLPLRPREAPDVEPALFVDEHGYSDSLETYGSSVTDEARAEARFPLPAIDSFQLMIFDCCAWCTEPTTIELTHFRWHSPEVNVWGIRDLGHMLIRRASPRERTAVTVPLSAQDEVFALVSRPREGLDSPVFLFVARDVIARHHPHVTVPKG